MPPDTTDIRVGDWVRFLRHGQLTISVVCYLVPRSPWDSTREAMTEIGQVSFDAIVEVRRAS